MAIMEYTAMILLTGGTGNIGRYLVQNLVDAGAKLRVLSRDPAKAQLPEGVEVVPGDLADRDALSNALAGVDRAFLLSGGGQDTAVENNLVELAQEHSLLHLVKLSAQEREDQPPAPHAAVEAAIKTSGVPYTFLRPTTFMQNMLWRLAPTVRTQNYFAVLDIDATIGMVDVRDIAATAAAILFQPDAHQNRAYVLTGPETLTYRQMEESMTEVLGRPIAVESMSTNALTVHLMNDVGFPQEMIPFLLSIERNLAAGWSAVVTDHVEQVTGNRPRSFKDFVLDYAPQFSS